MATRSEVKDFLREVSANIKLGRCTLNYRAKNWEGVFGPGLILRQTWQAIQSLTADHYAAGPERDNTNPANEVWKFGYQQEGKEVYIKLGLRQHRKRRTWKHVYVWSFHVAESPMKYPLRGDKS